MYFAANPLSLSVPEPAFEAWLRYTGYLEILDATSSSSSSSSSFPPSSLPPSPSTSKPLPVKNPAAATIGAIAFIFFFLRTIASLFSINLFAKLTPEDFDGETPAWTDVFIGGADSYSWPAGPSQARMRAQENVRRYARNYAFLSLIFFACSLYQMPVPFLGLIACLGLWELLKFCSDRWELEEKRPTVRTAMVRLVQSAMLMTLYLSNFQIALFSTLSISYTVMILHASIRKLTPSKYSLGANHGRRSRQKKVHLPAK